MSFQPPGTFIKHLTENGFRSSRGMTREEGLEIHWLDLTHQLKLNVGRFTPLVVDPRLSGHNIVQAERLLPTLESVKPILRKSKQEKTSFAVLVVGGLLANVPEALWGQLREGSIALVDKSTIENIYKERYLEPKVRHFCAALVRSLGYATLSPYRVGRPAYGTSFFGRGRILQTILAGRRGSSYTIIGNRRIGKTSLLREIKHRLRLQDPDIHVADIYGGNVDSTEQALTEILVRLDLMPSFPANEASLKKLFPAFIHSIPDKQHHQVALFIDELDHLLELDARHGYELLELLRATFEHEECRIFLAGFRRTREASQRMNTPLFNFTTPVSLSRLTREETMEMITRPLRLLGLETVTTDLPAAVHRETGGQPELVQIFGTELVATLESAKGRLPDTNELLESVLESKLFRDKVLSTFLSNTTPYEELICYLLIDTMRRELRGRPFGEFEFGYDLMNTLLKSKGFRLGMRELYGIAENLQVAGVISPVAGVGEDRFTFSVPQLANYCINMNLSVSIETALERVQTAPDQETALWGDIPGEPDHDHANE